ncbi:ArsR/SmtB family transcription factor [Alteromonas halophila]|uniref:Transcriptional regulator n=1 Tax=Alteromonas halophila TaxID=516698 RepID=A0A918N0H4_9ALTE|nr:metalloregulator ArsR/SmtB family transcription factor [Alteromonas halophila]GGW89879.1 transcriptional regulator [Alteromonas halophila]
MVNIEQDTMLAHASDAEQYLKLLANKTRLMVLCSLLEEELSVTTMLTFIPVTQPVLSQHLAILRDASLVATRREGQTIYYRLADDRIRETIGLLYRFFCSDR